MSSLDNVRPHLEEYGELRSTKKAAEERMKELDAVIRPMLDGKGAVVVGNFMFELKVNAGRNTLDKAALIADGVDVELYMKKGAPYTALFIKELG